MPNGTPNGHPNVVFTGHGQRVTTPSPGFSGFESVEVYQDPISNEGAQGQLADQGPAQQMASQVQEGHGQGHQVQVQAQAQPFHSGGQAQGNHAQQVLQHQGQAMFGQQHHQQQGQAMFAQTHHVQQHHQPQDQGVLVQNSHAEQAAGVAQGVQGNGSLFSQPHHYGQGHQTQVQGVYVQHGQQHLVNQAAPSPFMGSGTAPGLAQPVGHVPFPTPAITGYGFSFNAGSLVQGPQHLSGAFGFQAPVQSGHFPNQAYFTVMNPVVVVPSITGNARAHYEAQQRLLREQRQRDRDEISRQAREENRRRQNEYFRLQREAYQHMLMDKAATRARRMAIPPLGVPILTGPPPRHKEAIEARKKKIEMQKLLPKDPFYDFLDSVATEAIGSPVPITKLECTLYNRIVELLLKSFCKTIAPAPRDIDSITRKDNPLYYELVRKIARINVEAIFSFDDPYFLVKKGKQAPISALLPVMTRIWYRKYYSRIRKYIEKRDLRNPILRPNTIKLQEMYRGELQLLRKEIESFGNQIRKLRSDLGTAKFEAEKSAQGIYRPIPETSWRTGVIMGRWIKLDSLFNDIEDGLTRMHAFSHEVIVFEEEPEPIMVDEWKPEDWVLPETFGRQPKIEDVEEVDYAEHFFSEELSGLASIVQQYQEKKGDWLEVDLMYPTISLASSSGLKGVKRKFEDMPEN